MQQNKSYECNHHCERRLSFNQLLGDQFRHVAPAGRSGWPGTMGQFASILKRKDVPFDEIRYAVATHYHIDHAGLGQELKQAGVPLLVLDVQVDAISAHDNVG